MGVKIELTRVHPLAPVTGVTLAWWRKEGDEFRAAYAERRRSKLGRIELGDDQHGPAGPAGSQRGGELRPIGALAALHLLELRHHLAAGLGDVGGDGLALCLKAKPGSSLAIGADAKVRRRTARAAARSCGGLYYPKCGAIIHPKD